MPDEKKWQCIQTDQPLNHDSLLHFPEILCTQKGSISQRQFSMEQP